MATSGHSLAFSRASLDLQGDSGGVICEAVHSFKHKIELKIELRNFLRKILSMFIYS